MTVRCDVLSPGSYPAIGREGTRWPKMVRVTADTARARSFGAVAAEYHRARTGYSTEDIAWALHLPDRTPETGLHVLDVAAGTGRLTLVVLALATPTDGAPAAVSQLTAVEPDPQMRAEFRRRLPAGAPVTLRDGTAEAIPLPDAAVDAVIVGSAYHWFDPEPAAAELARVLRPGGTLAALWTQPDDEVAWIRGYRNAGRSAMDDAAPDGQPGGGTSPAPSAQSRYRNIPASPWFAPTERRESVHTEIFQRTELIAAVGTYSDLLVVDPPQRSSALAAVAAAVAEVVPDEALDPSGAVRLPVRVRAARCTRR